MSTKTKEPEEPLGPFQVTVTAYRCRCGHEWLPRDFTSVERPRVCPRCKSANWDRPYKLRRLREVSPTGDTK